MKKGFDNEKYVKIQSEHIKERFNLFDKLYLEVGGKLFDDSHAARVLPGFKNDAKISMFQELKNDLEIIFCINAGDIEKNKTRAEYGITYDTELMRIISRSESLGFKVNSVVVTLYKNQPSVDKFIKRLNRNGIKTYIHTFTKGYPTDVDTIVSEEGYGKNPYIKTTKKLILVNAPGPGSGKLATCLSQLYHEHKNGVNAGYAKFETFPVWNLPLKHPVNIAYEAATADLKDVNQIDFFHLEKYGVTAINYNRDLEMFPVLKNILTRITGASIYNSPTDMGVNMVGNCISDDEVVQLAAKKEVVRRYYNELTNYRLGLVDEDTPQKVKMLMNELEIDEEILPVVAAARAKINDCGLPSIALELPNGDIVTGRQTDLLSPASSAVINAIKVLTKIPDDVDLLASSVLKPILKLKNSSNPFENVLSLQETIIALSICSVTNPIIGKAIDSLKKLEGCEAHATYIIQDGELNSIKKLKINLTCEPEFLSDNLYQ
ncbi:MAG: DUF1846 domain-containing protein [Bacilli bacterium]|nr:DUF1846 domain-containing protein [Bacilli bacterium]